MKKIKLFEEFNSSEAHLNEAFEVHYSDGVRGMQKFNDKNKAIKFMKDKIANSKNLKEIAIYNAGSGFHSTADTDAVVSWWGEGSYLDNVSKKDAKLAAKKLEESLIFEAKAKGLDWVISELGDKPKCMDVAEFVYDNYDKVTGLRKSMRNDEMDFPDEIMNVVDHYGLDIDEFTDCYGMAAESLKIDEKEVNLFDEVGPELEALRSKISGLMKKSKDNKWTSALGKALTALSTLDRNLSQADSKLGVVPVHEGVVSIKGGRIIAHKVLNKLVDMGLIPVKKKSEDLLETIAKVITDAKMESLEINEGAVKAFEIDYANMEKAIKRGMGWIDPEYVEETWENSSNTIAFQLVKGEIYKRLIAANLLAYPNPDDEESKGVPVRKLQELGIKESVINEAYDIKVSLKHAKDAIALYNDMFIKYGKRPSSDVFSFKQKDAAVDFVQMLVKNLQIPMGEIEADKDIIKNLK